MFFFLQADVVTNDFMKVSSTREIHLKYLTTRSVIQILLHLSSKISKSLTKTIMDYKSTLYKHLIESNGTTLKQWTQCNEVNLIWSNGNSYMCRALKSLQWHHNGCDGVSQPFVQVQIKENIKLCVTRIYGGIHHWPVDSPNKRPVMLKTSPFDDVVISVIIIVLSS